MANEGLRLVGEGIVRRPSDIDHLMVAGHGFARWKGGPMHQASERGLLVLRADLRRWQAEDPVWTPAHLLDELVSDGKGLEALNARRP
jgi:3-hydroxyacyl-CoA dehydrogenase